MIGSAVSGVQIWVATTPVDMRQGFDRLEARVREHLGHNPLGGHLFVFRNKSAARVKVLWWDGSGVVRLSERKLGSGGGNYRQSQKRLPS